MCKKHILQAPWHLDCRHTACVGIKNGQKMLLNPLILLRWGVRFTYPLVFGFGTLALAGSVSGPNVVWVNLDQSGDAERVNNIVASFVNNRETSCHGNWFPGVSLLYMKKRPQQISDELVWDVFLRKKSSQRKRLNLALREYKDAAAYDGFDGIIVYSRSKNSTMMRLTTGKNKIEKFALSINGKTPEKQDVEDAFCVLLPPITRLP